MRLPSVDVTVTVTASNRQVLTSGDPGFEPIGTRLALVLFPLPIW